MFEVALRQFRFSVAEGYNFHSMVWVGEPEDAAAVRMAVVKTKVKFRPNLMVAMGERQLGPSETLDEYIDQQIGLCGKLPNYRLVSRSPLREDKSASVLRHSLRNSQGVGVEQLQYYVKLADRRVVIMTATHMAGANFQSTTELFRRMLDSMTDSDGNSLVSD